MFEEEKDVGGKEESFGKPVVKKKELVMPACGRTVPCAKCLAAGGCGKAGGCGGHTHESKQGSEKE